MTAISNLVRKLKRAVTGTAEPVGGEQPFRWEPAPVAPLPGPRALEPPAAAEPEAPPGAPAAPEPSVEHVPAAPAPSRKRPQQLDASSVVGADIPADVGDFSAVYQGARVEAPSHGYGVDRVAQMLEHRSLSGLDRGVKASAVLAALDAAGVHIHDVIHDGLLRYKALVAFEAAKELEFHGVRPRNEHRVEQLKLAIASFQHKKNAELDALTHEASAAVAALNRLKSRQRAEEERFHRAISWFVEPLPARILPMTPKAEAPAAEVAEPRPELKLVFATPPLQDDPHPAPAVAPAPPDSSASEARELPVVVFGAPAVEPAQPAEAAIPESQRSTIKLTPEQMSLIASADLPEAAVAPPAVPEESPSTAPTAGGVVVSTDASSERPPAPEDAQEPPPPAPESTTPEAPIVGVTADQAGEIVAGFHDAADTSAAAEGTELSPAMEAKASKDPTIRLTAEQAAAIVADFREAGADIPAAEEGGEPRPSAAEAKASKDPTVRLTAEQAAAIVAGFRDAGADPAAAGGGSEPQPSATELKASKDPTVRLTAEQAAAIVADFRDARSDTPGPGEDTRSQSSAPDAPATQDPAMHLTAEQTAGVVAGQGAAASPKAPGDAQAPRPRAPKESTIRLTADQARAILASFAAAASAEAAPRDAAGGTEPEKGGETPSGGEDQS